MEREPFVSPRRSPIFSPTIYQKRRATNRRNLLVSTEALTAAAWEGYYVKPTLSSGQLDPEGKNTAFSWQTNLTSAGPESRYGGLLVSAPVRLVGRLCTASVWLRSSVNMVVRFGVDDQSATSINVTTTWQRFTRTGVISAVNPRLFQVYDDMNTVDGTLFLWHPQTEFGPMATDYQPVNTASDYN